MKYVIKYHENIGCFVMEDDDHVFVEEFIGTHLEYIAAYEGLDPSVAFSESHLLHMLREIGVEVDLIDDDGSPLDY